MPEFNPTLETDSLQNLWNLDLSADLQEGSVHFEGLSANWRPKNHDILPLSPSDHVQLYTYMTLHRRFEETLERLFRQGLVPGTVFFGRGNEATAVGSAYALGPRDILSPLHRNLGARFVRGQTLKRTMAQFLGRMDGYTRGRDGNVHHGDRSRRILSMVSHLGTMIPIAAGTAYAACYRREDAVALSFIGEGATSTGDFHEGMNFAAVHRLPLVVVIENNQWAYKTPAHLEYATPCLAMRGPGYGIPGWLVDGTDVLEVYAVCRDAIQRARDGKGPTLIESVTMRLCGHSVYDRFQDYVPEEQLKAWEARDPIQTYEAYLLSQGLHCEETLRGIREKVGAEIEEAVEFAKASPIPDPREVEEGVYADREE
ncbi:MAG: thiamine pyrophosphate-dependent dehydrogenase E1 component subunit alpha [Candidatus Tectomicrobia bacterium]|nr:thiamine pyrophosphate-dependent dehydrogenase E1 component subunit alpha [Candidatus Tectomicrobia bacterium]